MPASNAHPSRTRWPRIPETKAEIEALGLEELKALALAYPEAECLPEEKRKPWLSERRVGLTQAVRDGFRAALDAADATRDGHSAIEQRLAGTRARSDIRLTRRREALIHQ